MMINLIFLQVSNKYYFLFHDRSYFPLVGSYLIIKQFKNKERYYTIYDIINYIILKFLKLQIFQFTGLSQMMINMIFLQVSNKYHFLFQDRSYFILVGCYLVIKQFINKEQYYTMYYIINYIILKFLKL